MVTHQPTRIVWSLASSLVLVCNAGVGTLKASDGSGDSVQLAAPQQIGPAPKPETTPAPPPNDTPAPPKAEGEMDVLMRGPLHEAFATQVSLEPEAGPVVAKQSPQPIDEVPPETRPAGDNVQWIPGYWAWDDTAKDYLWVSGLWRNIPPDRRWVPGYWGEAEGGWRWHSGAWLEAQRKEVEYLPAPQPSLERGPTVAASSPDQIWVPGCWVYRDLGYHWRPGYWIVGRPGWVWIPDNYVWTPRGVIFVGGYWDYGLEGRGTPFCPVVFHGTPYLAVGYHYRPSVVIATDLLLVHLFVHPSYHHYYFGDYYHADFVRIGIHPWYDLQAYHHGYDPMWSYYRWDHARRGVDLDARLRGWHTYYERRPDLRPPHVFVVGSHLVEPGHGPHGSAHAPMLGMSLHEAVASPAAGKRFVTLTPAEVKAVHGSAGSMNGLVTQRRGLEVVKPSAGLLASGGAGKPSAGGVTSVKPQAVWKLPESASSVRAGVGKTTQSQAGTVGGVQPGTGHSTPKLSSGGTTPSPQTQPSHGRPTGMVPQSPPHQSQASRPSDKTRGKPKSDRREGTSVR